MKGQRREEEDVESERVREGRKEYKEGGRTMGRRTEREEKKSRGMETGIDKKRLHTGRERERTEG